MVMTSEVTGYVWKCSLSLTGASGVKKILQLAHVPPAVCEGRADWRVGYCQGEHSFLYRGTLGDRGTWGTWGTEEHGEHGVQRNMGYRGTWGTGNMAYREIGHRGTWGTEGHGLGDMGYRGTWGTGEHGVQGT